MDYVVRRIDKDELEHYGRLGMKWGQHIFGQEHVYKKSIKKLKKIDNRAQEKKTEAARLDYKSEKLRQKADRARSPKKYERISRQANAYRLQANREMWKSRKLETKAKKWVDTMNNHFDNVRINSVSTDDIAIGKRYAVQAVEDYMKNRK